MEEAKAWAGPVPTCWRRKGRRSPCAAGARPISSAPPRRFGTPPARTSSRWPAISTKPETARDLIAATVERFGRLDILINNSGGPPLARALTATEEQWATAVQRSLVFFARMSREAVPHMKRQGGGRIINVLASTVYQPIPNLALSGATRMGVVAFAKSLADEVGRDGILVNNVCPGSILTERMLSNVTARAKELGIPVEEALAQRATETAVGRIGDPRDMAYLVAFLASGKASYITGTTILVDGGLVRSVL